MEIQLSNTLTGEKQVFKPLKKGSLSMYNCGPTVYDFAHIGNMRAYVFADILRRAFEYAGYDVNQVINITDIGHLSGDADDGEDKMTKALKREGKPLTLEAMREVAEFYFEAFKKDLEKLNIEPPEHFPFASDHIPEDIKLIQTLIEKDFTYNTSDGIYFDTSKDSGYGKLNHGTSGEEERPRITQNSEKKNPKDFALWKFNESLGYEAPFGKGFPGWHIECSAMSMKYLGETFDIHTGGIEHIPIHHNNEIAQSENATGKPFVNYWLHHNHITVDGSKMAKSEGTGHTLKDLEEKGIHPLSFKYWLLTAHYKSPANFTWEAILGAQKAFEKIVQSTAISLSSGETDTETNEDFEKEFFSYIYNDLDTPKAIALLNKLSDQNISGKINLVKKFDKVLGLNIIFLAKQSLEISPEVKSLLEERDSARSLKDWEKSDELRDKIQNMGYAVFDTAEKTFAIKTLPSLIKGNRL